MRIWPAQRVFVYPWTKVDANSSRGVDIGSIKLEWRLKSCFAYLCIVCLRWSVMAMARYLKWESFSAHCGVRNDRAFHASWATPGNLCISHTRWRMYHFSASVRRSLEAVVLSLLTENQAATGLWCRCQCIGNHSIEPRLENDECIHARCSTEKPKSCAQ